MSISFNQVPNTQRVPFSYIEFDNSRAQQGPTLKEYKALALGQRLAGGSRAELVSDLITSEDQAKDLYGQGSMLAKICESFLNNNKVDALTAISIDDLLAGVAATGKLAFAGPATASGTLYVYIGGERYTVGVTSGDTADDIAAALVAELGLAENADIEVSAVVNGGNLNEVDLTAKHKGELGNKIDLRFNYFDGEEFPAGVSCTITAMNGGTGNPDVDEILAVLDETQYDIIVFPWLDASNLTKIESELSDRFGPLRQNDGTAISAEVDSLGNLSTLGNSRNSQHLSIMEFKGSPTTPWYCAGAYAAVASNNLRQDPARPLQTLELRGVLPPKKEDRLTLAERNILLFDGIATHNVDAGDVVRIERAITTFKTNAFGQTDVSYLDLNTVKTLSYLRYDFRTQILSKYPRHKLANDGTRFGAGQAIITPSVGKAEAVAIFRGWEELGLVEGADQFKRDLIVERNKQDVNRLDFLLPPDLTNQLRITGIQVQFLL